MTQPNQHRAPLKMIFFFINLKKLVAQVPNQYLLIWSQSLLLALLVRVFCYPDPTPFPTGWHDVLIWPALAPLYRVATATALNAVSSPSLTPEAFCFYPVAKIQLLL